jgi:hypothetical protein
VLLSYQTQEYANAIINYLSTIISLDNVRDKVRNSDEMGVGNTKGNTSLRKRKR